MLNTSMIPSYLQWITHGAHIYPSIILEHKCFAYITILVTKFTRLGYSFLASLRIINKAIAMTTLHSVTII